MNRFSLYIVSVRNLLRVALLTLAQLWLLSTASAQLVLYDNFSKKTIDPTKWEGWQDTDTTLRETIRELTPTPRNYDDNRLHLSQRVYSAVTDDNGGSGGAWVSNFPIQPRLPRSPLLWQ